MLRDDKMVESDVSGAQFVFSTTLYPIPDPTGFFFPVSCFSLKTILVSARPTILFGEQGIVDKLYNNYGKSHLLIDGWSTSQSHHILATVNWHHWPVKIWISPHVQRVYVGLSRE